MQVSSRLKGIHFDICRRVEVDGPPQADTDYKSFVKCVCVFLFFQGCGKKTAQLSNVVKSVSLLISISNFFPILINFFSGAWHLALNSTIFVLLKNDDW